MIYTINITTKTRPGDAYSSVAINNFPIIYISEESVEDIYDNEDLIEIVRKYIKNKTTYENAILSIRTLSDDFLESNTYAAKVQDKIHLEEWT